MSAPPFLFTSLARAPSDALVSHRLKCGLSSEEVLAFRRDFESHSLVAEEDRAIGAMLGMAIGDSLGAPFEFLPYRPAGAPPSSAGLTEPPLDEVLNAFALKPGQWTDDASMGLCLADSLLASPGFSFSPLDLMLRFTAWWEFGYNNAFADDAERGRTHGGFGRAGRSSVGQGGIISASMSAFLKHGHAFTQAGDDRSSGNGSIMRLAAVPVLHHSNEALAAEVGRGQSRTTHRGIEAAECAALMATIIVRAIHASSAPPASASASGGSGEGGSSSAASATAGASSTSSRSCSVAAWETRRGVAPPSLLLPPPPPPPQQRCRAAASASAAAPCGSASQSA